MVILFCSGCLRRSFVKGFVMRLVHTSLCETTDRANSVSYCVTVCGCGLVFSMASCNCRALWSSLYSPNAAINSCLFVKIVPFQFTFCQASGRFFMVVVYCSSV
jgi:hypothetical protein